MSAKTHLFERAANFVAKCFPKRRVRSNANTWGLEVLENRVLMSTTTRVSVSSSGVEANQNSYDPTISADGRYVAFESSASNLVPGDTNNTADIFVYDRQTQTTQRVSVASDGAQANGTSEQPSISADGRYVTFESSAWNLAPGFTNLGNYGSYVYDRETQTTELISYHTIGSTKYVDQAFDPSLSADGRYVVFNSHSNSLVLGDTNMGVDIFVYDRQAKTTTRVSVASDGTQGNNYNDGYGAPSISADGRYVAFISESTNLVPGGTTAGNNTYVHDLQTHTTELVSISSTGIQSNGFSSDVTISADGRYVAFSSSADNLVPGYGNLASELIYVHDRQLHTTQCVSITNLGTQANAGCANPYISSDNRYVSFGTFASNLVPGFTTTNFNVYVYDLQTHAVKCVTVTSNGMEGNNHSGNISNGKPIGTMSSDGRYVAFQSLASNLVAGDTNNKGDIFVYDVGLASISGTVFSDANNNGAKDAGETGMAGVTVLLKVNGAVQSSVFTAADGTYTFDNLNAGTYTIEELVPSDHTQTDPTANSGTYIVNLAAGQNVTGDDFGNHKTPLIPAVSWSVPNAINYGTALSAVQLNATSDIPGTFVYTPSAGTLLHAGANQILSVLFTPTDTTNYSTVTGYTHITVNQVAPVVTWSAPSAINYGTALSAAQLNATANVPGTFVYTPAAGSILPVGANQPLSMIFMPTDITDYTTANGSTQITVNKSTLAIIWPAPTALTYGTPLSADQLNATANIPGTFVYTPAIGTVLNAGANQSLSVLFTPTDTTNYTNTNGSTLITVDKATPEVTWTTPAAIVYGTTLSTNQLNAIANVPGIFVYTPAAGTILNAGINQSLNVLFTPTDTTNYTTVNDSTNLTVYQASTITTVISSKNPSPHGPMVTFTATVTPANGTDPTGIVQFQIDGSNVDAPVKLSNNIATYTTKIPSPGSHAVRAIYFGDGNFIGSTSPAIAQTITAPLGDKVKKFSYTQTDGTKVSITLTGLTAQVLLHGSSLVLSTVITGITTITGSVDSIDIAIDPASSAPVTGTLTFTTTKPTVTSNLPGNGVAKVGSITGQSLSTLAAGSVDLIGVGLNFSGSIGTTTLHDLTNGADITYSGFTTKPLTMSYQIINSGSTIRTNSAIGTFKANSVAPGSQIDTPWLATLITTALTARSLTGDFGATLNLTGVGIKGQQNTTLGTMTIAGAISNAHIHSAGNIGTVTAGSMINSELYAGVNTINNALPMNASELAMNASIASLTIKGITGSNAFVNSNIAAATLTMVSLKDAQLNNSGTHFGISARTIKALTLTQGKTKYTWSPTSTAKWIATPVDLTVLDV